MGIQKFLKKPKLEEILSAINEAYSEPESLEEITLREKTKRYYSKKILKEESAAFDHHIKK